MGDSEAFSLTTMKSVGMQLSKEPSLSFDERMVLRPFLWAKMSDLTGSAFQDFFNSVMRRARGDFIDVRTNGSMGDFGCDGLTSRDRKLYACYGPEDRNSKGIAKKFESDLKSAVRQRGGDFDTFVFVHNDVRGTRPDLSVMLSRADKIAPGKSIELMTFEHFFDAIGQLSKSKVEAILGRQLPLESGVAFGPGELADLLDYLGSLPLDGSSPDKLHPVSAKKLDFAGLNPHGRSDVRSTMKFSPMVEKYYDERNRVLELEEVSQRFRNIYAEAVQEGLQPDAILHRVRVFVSGNRSCPPSLYYATSAVLAFFFQRCDIFENAPEDWGHPETTGTS